MKFLTILLLTIALMFAANAAASDCTEYYTGQYLDRGQNTAAEAAYIVAACSYSECVEYYTGQYLDRGQNTAAEAAYIEAACR